LKENYDKIALGELPEVGTAKVNSRKFNNTVRAKNSRKRKLSNNDVLYGATKSDKSISNFSLVKFQQGGEKPFRVTKP